MNYQPDAPHQPLLHTQANYPQFDEQYQSQYHQNPYQPPNYPQQGQIYLPPNEYGFYPDLQPNYQPYNPAAVNEEAQMKQRKLMELDKLERSFQTGCFYFYYLMLYIVLVANAFMLWNRFNTAYYDGDAAFSLSIFILGFLQTIFASRGMRKYSPCNLGFSMVIGVAYASLCTTFVCYCATNQDLMLINYDECMRDSFSRSYYSCDRWMRRYNFYFTEMFTAIVSIVLSVVFYLMVANIVRRRLVKITKLRKQINIDA